MNTGSNADFPPAADQALRQEKSGGSLWLWVVAGFLLLVLAWTVLFSVAHSAKVETVPLVPREAKP